MSAQAARDGHHPRPGGNLHDLVLRMVPREAGKVLDAASGDGYVAQQMRGMGFAVTCADIHFDANFPIPDPVVADFNEKLPFGDEQFDGVVSVETIEHIENPWLFTRELARVTRPGGFVVISTPNTGNLQSRLLMLLEARPAWFRPHHIDPLGHITPIFSHLIAEMAQRAGLMPDGRAYSWARIPRTMKRLPVTNELVRECAVRRYRKRS